MKLFLKKISIKNFLSVGAVPIVLNYAQGNHAIIGENGSGKSSLGTDALVFAFKGISLRELNKDQMINSINESDCEVKLWFSINGVNYRIERGLKPNFVRLINEDDEANDINQAERASLREGQKEIDNLLKISTASLINLITQNINYSKPFLKLDASDRRQIMLDVMNVSIYGKMLEKSRKDYNSAKHALKVLAAELKGLEDTLQTKLDTLSKINDYKKEFEQNKKTQIEKLCSLEKETEENIKNLESQLSDKDAKTMLDRLLETKEKMTEFLISATNKIKENENIIHKNTVAINKIKNSPVCSECNTPTTGEHAQKHIKDKEAENIALTVKNSEIKEKYQTNSEKYKLLLENIKKAESFIKNQDLIKEKIRNNEHNLRHIKDQILEIELKKFEVKNIVDETDIKNTETKVAIKKKELAEKDKELVLLMWLESVLEIKESKASVLNRLFQYSIKK